MNNKAIKIHRSNIKDYPERTDTNTDKTLQDIINNTTQIAVNRIDEVTVMQSMLNDSDFKIALYNSKKGYYGSRCPREEALSISIDILSGATGMSSKEARALVEGYEYTKRDAQKFINIGKDFVSTYLQSGRKLNVISEERGECYISMNYKSEHTKTVPNNDKPGTTITKNIDEKIRLKVNNK